MALRGFSRCFNACLIGCYTVTTDHSGTSVLAKCHKGVLYITCFNVYKRQVIFILFTLSLGRDELCSLCMTYC